VFNGSRDIYQILRHAQVNVKC